MLKNYLKIAFRSLWRHKAYSFINIFGLALGVTCALLLFFYIRYQFSHDTYHEHAENLYVVRTYFIDEGEADSYPQTVGSIASTLEKDYPEVVAAARLRHTGRRLLSHGDTRFYEEEMFYVDQDFFKLGSYDFLAGTPEKALKDLQSVVLTHSLAKKLFGGAAQAMNQTLVMDDESFVVSAVIADVPENSRYTFQALFPILAIPRGQRENIGAEGWQGVGCAVLVRLQAGQDEQTMQPKLDHIYQKYMKALAEEDGYESKLELNALANFHIYHGDDGQGTLLSYLYLLILIASVILLIASINYINLATARSLQRAREVGIRKVIGSHRWQLRMQFLAESSLITLVAIFLSFVLAELLIPYFNQMIRENLQSFDFFTVQGLLIFLALWLGLSLLSGVYPAMVLSSFEPVKVLKGKFASSRQGNTLRKSLVVFQFTASVILLICTLGVFRQLNYIMQKDVGFSREQVVILNMTSDELFEKAPVMRARLLQNPRVKQVAMTSLVPSYNSWAYNPYEVESKQEAWRDISVDVAPVGYHYLETMEMKLTSGRDFDPNIPSDSSEAIIVNEAFVKAVGWENPLGKKVRSSYSKSESKVIGVVKDFHLHSLHENIRPTLMYISSRPYNLMIKVQPQELSATLGFIKEIWQEFEDEYPFEPNFLDEAFTENYKQDQLLGRIFLSFALLAVGIACLGLFGLASYTVQQRTKEIGIRKVLGANLQNIVFLVSGNFVKLILLACLLGFPIAYYLLNQILQNYAYRMELNGILFLATMLLTLLVTFLTISTQIWYATRLNPVRVLRDE